MVAGLVMVGFAYLTPPGFRPSLLRRVPLVGALPGDFPVYLWRFLLSFLLLGVIPLLTALLCGERLRDLGLRLPGRPFAGWLWAPIVALAAVIALTGAYSKTTGSYYPYSRTLLQRIAQHGWAPFGLHALLYLCLYYLPWELFFRGLLLFPFLRLISAQGEPPFPALLAVACFQTLPSTLLHFGHPVTETLGAVFFGVGTGYLALRTRSILPGLALHAGIGISQDLLIALRYVGVLP